MFRLLVCLVVLFIAGPLLAQVKTKAKVPEMLAPAVVAKIDYKAAVTSHLKENVNDASKLEIVKFSKPVDLAKCYYFANPDALNDDEKQYAGVGEHTWRPFTQKGIGVVCKFRATNDLGALVIEEGAFAVSVKGEVIAAMETADFTSIRPTGRGDPALDGFFGGVEAARDGLPEPWRSIDPLTGQKRKIKSRRGR